MGTRPSSSPWFTRPAPIPSRRCPRASPLQSTRLLPIPSLLNKPMLNTESLSLLLLPTPSPLLPTLASPDTLLPPMPPLDTQLPPMPDLDTPVIITKLRCIQHQVP